MTASPSDAVLIAYGLAFLRVATALRLLPMLAGGLAPSVAWLSLSAALAATLSFTLPGALAADDLTSLELGIAALRELLAGLILGAAGRMTFALLEIVGGLGANAIWPSAGEDALGPALPFAYGLVGAASLLAMGGHRVLLTALSASFTSWPMGASLAPIELEPFLAMIAASLGTGVLLALPLLAAALFADAVTGLLERLSIGTFDTPILVARQLCVQAALGAVLGVSVTRFAESCAALKWLVT